MVLQNLYVSLSINGAFTNVPVTRTMGTYGVFTPDVKQIFTLRYLRKFGRIVDEFTHVSKQLLNTGPKQRGGATAIYKVKYFFPPFFSVINHG